ncbi:MAG: 3-oxoacyl-ACP synthase III family protein [bacterium]|nr:3-oxoacyl-ACP synthase III family protein [bacterium]
MNSMHNKKSAGILGMGVCMPNEVRYNTFWDNLIPNADIVSGLTGDDAFKGIKERRIFPEDYDECKAEVIASKNAIKDANLEVDDIDMIMAYSSLPKHLLPGNAYNIQYKLGIKNCMTLNIEVMCASFITHFILAADLIKSGTYKNILIVNSAVWSRVADLSDPTSRFFGDGTSACVIGEVPEGRGFIASHFISDGKFFESYGRTVRKPYKEYRFGSKKEGTDQIFATFYDMESFKDFTRNFAPSVKTIFKVISDKSGLKKDDLDMCFFHQGVHWMPNMITEALDIDISKTYQTFSKYGNLSAASIPVSLHEARQNGTVKEGDVLFMWAPGAGAAYAGLALKL